MEKKIMNRRTHLQTFDNYSNPVSNDKSPPVKKIDPEQWEKFGQMITDAVNNVKAARPEMDRIVRLAKEGKITPQEARIRITKAVKGDLRSDQRHRPAKVPTGDK